MRRVQGRRGEDRGGEADALWLVGKCNGNPAMLRQVAVNCRAKGLKGRGATLRRRGASCTTHAAEERAAR